MEENISKGTTARKIAENKFCKWLETVELLLKKENWHIHALGSIGANGQYMKSADDRKLFYIQCQPSGCGKLRNKIR